MSVLQTTKYEVKHPILKQFIKYFWLMRSSNQIEINHKLLPVGNIDLVLNFSEPIHYTSIGKTELIPDKFHFNGIREEYCIINQQGKFDIWGISFYPAGLYPFFKIPINEFTGKTINLDLVAKRFVLEIEEKMSIAVSDEQKLNILEKELLELIYADFIPDNAILNIIDNFYTNMENISISNFCDKFGINLRKLERIFNKYIGVSPKVVHKLARYQGICNQLIHQDNVDLTFEAYQSNYYDQTHFLKDFKSFTGCSPTQFMNEKRAVKQII